MNWTLIKKDLRLMRPVTIGAIALAIVFYVAIPSSAAYERFRQLSGSGYETWTIWDKLHAARFDILGGISVACVVANGCLLLWGAVIGGMAFALERRERWGDLLGTLPVTREQWIGTKFASSMIWSASVLFVNCFLFVANTVTRTTLSLNAVDYSARTEKVQVKDFAESTLSISCYALALFGMAWLMSAMIRSAAIAAAIPIGVVLVAFVMFAVIFDGSPLKDLPQELQDAVLKFVLPLVIAVITIPIGIAIQRMRATP